MNMKSQNGSDKSKKLINLRDITIIVIMLLCVVLLYMFLKPKESGSIAVIEKNGNITEKIDFSTVSESYTVIVDNVEILIENDGVSVISSDCPDKVCIHTGKISHIGEVIACLPNKVTVVIEGNNTTLDGITE